MKSDDEFTFEIEELVDISISENTKKLLNLIKPHINLLNIKYENLFYQDENGDWISDEWDNELEKFFNKNVLSFNNELSDQVKKEFKKNYTEEEKLYNQILLNYFEYIDVVLKIKLKTKIQRILSSSSIDNIIESMNHFDLESDEITPDIFSKWVSQYFQIFEWSVFSIDNSGDDIGKFIAEKGDNTFVIMCKFCFQPLGEDIIEELNKIKFDFNLRIGLIVTNSSFMESSTKLGNSYNVKTLHYSKLSNFIKEFN